jgi:hypothetical protein
VSAEPENGARLLVELGDILPPDRIREVVHGFRAIAGDDRSTAQLRAATGEELDLAVRAHRTALLVWLRSWGCRHLRVADTARSSRALATWWGSNRDSLPNARRTLTAMSARELDSAAGAFGALAAAPAAWRSRPVGRASVSFGETGAAKALFAIRPLAFPPWDEPIRVALGLRGTGGPGYRSYLEQTARSLRGLADRLQVPVSRVPEALGRPGSTPPKLVDEYLWMRVNREP